jgi:hypothetical protein
MTDKLIEEEDWMTTLQAMYYEMQFKTLPELNKLSFNKGKDAKCRERDKDVCVLPGNLNPRVFWFIPPIWNDTVEYNNAMGNLEGVSLDLTDIDLLDDFCSAT